MNRTKRSSFFLKVRKPKLKKKCVKFSGNMSDAKNDSAGNH